MAENTRLGGIKQEFQEFKNSFQVMISDLRLDMERKFENTNNRLEELNVHLKTNIVDQMNESIMSIKDKIIDALKEDNAQLRTKVELLEKKLTEAEISHNKLEQHTRRNNVEIQGIPPQIPDEKLEEKVIEVFGAMNIAITKNDVEDCHRLGKSSENTIARFVNRKHCNAILSKKFETSKIDKSKLGFESNVKLYVSENLIPYNQHLAWKCRELKRAGVIHSSWSSKGIVKLRRTANECPIPIDHEDRIAALYPDFVFNQRQNFKDRE